VRHLAGAAAVTLALRFDPCFDQWKLRELAPHLPAAYKALNELCPWRRGRWPTRVRCLSKSRIEEGRARGAGHGMTYVGCSMGSGGCNEIWINPYMTVPGHYLVLIHENLHHGFPDATEDELNNVLVQRVYRRATGRKLQSAWARKHGLGPPRPGIGDRGYVR
jgi:hypothetical protein